MLVFLSVSLRPQVSQAALLLTAPSKLCRMLNPMPQKHILKLVVYRPFFDGLRVGQDVSPNETKSGVSFSDHIVYMPIPVNFGSRVTPRYLM